MVPQTPPSQSSLELLRESNPQVAIASAVNDTDVVFTGSGSQGSALAMDKDISKRLFRAAGILTPDWIMAPGQPRDGEAVLVYPVIVKPNSQGSTIGLSLVRGASDLDSAVSTAASYGDAIIEQFVPGRELTVGVLDGQALAAGEVLLERNSVFSYEEEYQAGAVKEVLPAQIPADVEEEAKRVALFAHNCLKLHDYGRSDFRLGDDGRLWLIEVNTLPGLTATSLLPQSAAAAGIDYPTLCEQICTLALRRSDH